MPARLLPFGLQPARLKESLLLWLNTIKHGPQYWHSAGLVENFKTLPHKHQILFDWNDCFGGRNLGCRGGNGRPRQTIQRFLVPPTMVLGFLHMGFFLISFNTKALIGGENEKGLELAEHCSTTLLNNKSRQLSCGKHYGFLKVFGSFIRLLSMAYNECSNTRGNIPLLFVSFLEHSVVEKFYNSTRDLDRCIFQQGTPLL